MKLIMSSFLTLAVALATLSSASADEYLIDTRGGHAGINFKFKHLGISWLVGEFKTFGGTFNYDPENIAASSVRVDIETASLDSNHAERDKHIRGGRYLDVATYPDASFVSSKVEDLGDGNMTIHGELSLRGQTKEIAIDASTVGAGSDPWGGYRVGLEGATMLDMRDFGVESFGPTHMVEMLLYVEGIRQ